MSNVKNYRIEFYQLSFQPSQKLATLDDAFQSVIDKISPASSNKDGYTRELWAMQKREDGSFSGELRKFRSSNIPEKGAVGKQSSPIPLEEDEGIIERNFFVYYPIQGIVGWHKNHMACGINRFASFLSTIFASKIKATPLLEKEALAKLMKGDVRMKKIALTIPRPRNTDFYPDTDFSKKTMALMGDTGADTMQIVMGINSRRGDSAGNLAQNIKYAMQELVGLGAKKAVIDIYDEDGAIHPIDLIAERIISTQSTETDAAFPPAGTMFRLIDTAYAENQENINGYIGAENTKSID